MAESENNLLRDAFVRHQIGLLRRATGMYNVAEELLDVSESRLRILIERFLGILEDERIDLRSPHVEDRLRRLRIRITELRLDAMRTVRENLTDESRSLVVAQWAWFAATAAAVTSGRVQPASPGGLREAQAIVRDIPFEGRTMRQWLDDLAVADARRIYGAVVVGLTQARSRRDILRSVFGTASLNGADGVTQQTRNNLNAIVRTAVTSHTSQANDAMAEVNGGVFSRDVYTAVLDSRTTPICRSLDGRVYPRGQGPIPPLHFFCRSVRIPLLPGEVPDRVTYAEWLRRQPAKFQDEVLGRVRGILFRRGGLTLDKFVDRSGRQFNLRELAKMDADAFRAAGLDPGDYGG